MMKVRRSVLLFLFAANSFGCGGASTPTTSSGSATPSASTGAAAPSVRATFDGKPLELVAFESIRRSDDEFDLVFGTHPECTTRASLKCPSGQSVVRLRVANTIAPDGARSWRIVRAGVNSSVDGASAPVKFEGDPSSRLTLTIPKLVIHEQALVIEGTVVAVGKAPEAPPAGAPQPEGKLSISGVAVPVQSAYLERGASGDTLYLYGGMMASCHSGDGDLAQPASVMIMLDKSGAPDVRVDGNLVLAGDGTVDPNKPRSAKLTVGAEKDGKFPVTAEVDYVSSGVPIKASGTFTANRCE